MAFAYKTLSLTKVDDYVDRINARISPYTLKGAKEFLNGDVVESQFHIDNKGRPFIRMGHQRIYLLHEDPNQAINAAFLDQHYLNPDGSYKPMNFFNPPPPSDPQVLSKARTFVQNNTETAAAAPVAKTPKSSNNQESV